MTKITIKTLDDISHQNKRFACITAYDASFAKLVALAEIEVLLIGDSLGNVIQGQKTTVPVTMDDMAYHLECVCNGLQNQDFKPFLVADMPFMSYATQEIALANTKMLMQSGAQMVKVEGADWLLDSIYFLSERGINLCGHLGLTPQTVDSLGGFRVQGRGDEQEKALLNQAISLQDAGARMLVLECIPSELGKQITASLDIPVIGIGAGPFTNSQVLVLYDLLAITVGKRPRFVKDFLTGNTGGILGALKDFRQAVLTGEYPQQEHCFD